MPRGGLRIGSRGWTGGGSLRISNTDCLSQAEAEAFAASISVGGYVTVEGNGADYPCE